MRSSDLLDILRGGDLRSIGRCNEVVARVLDEPELFDELVEGMVHDNPGLADLALAHSDLRPEVRTLVERLAEAGSPAMRARGRKLLAQLDRSQASAPS